MNCQSSVINSFFQTSDRQIDHQIEILIELSISMHLIFFSYLLFLCLKMRFLFKTASLKLFLHDLLYSIAFISFYTCDIYTGGKSRQKQLAHIIIDTCLLINYFSINIIYCDISYRISTVDSCFINDRIRINMDIYLLWFFCY